MTKFFQPYQAASRSVDKYDMDAFDASPIGPKHLPLLAMMAKATLEQRARDAIQERRKE